MEAPDEQRIDVARAVAAIRRGASLIVLIVVPLTLAVLTLSLVLPKSYSSTATLVVGERDTSTDADSATRRLATLRRLLISSDVLAQAARGLPGESLDTLRDKVTVSLDDAADIIQIKATDGDAQGTAAIANRVATTFLAWRREADRRSVARARQDVLLALDRADARDASAEEVRALRDRLSQLSVREASPDDEVQIAQAAVPPEHPSSPRPLQNAVFAFLAALFLAVLAALARDRLAPRVLDPKQLTTLTGLSPLVVLPKRGRSRLMHEADEALAASVRVQLSDSQRVLLVTSPDGGEDRAAVAAGLAAALAAAGAPTLLVSADMRHSDLHHVLGVPATAGLEDVLRAIERDGDDRSGRTTRAIATAGLLRSHGELSVLPSGKPADHPTALLSGEALGMLLEDLGQWEYRYIVIEGPPLLGPIDGQLVAHWADAILVVCRLDRLTPADAAELGGLLARLRAPVLGSVVLGGSHVSYSLPAWTPVRAPSDV